MMLKILHFRTFALVQVASLPMHWRPYITQGCQLEFTVGPEYHQKFWALYTKRSYYGLKMKCLGLNSGYCLKSSIPIHTPFLFQNKAPIQMLARGKTHLAFCTCRWGIQYYLWPNRRHSVSSGSDMGRHTVFLQKREKVITMKRE